MTYTADFLIEKRKEKWAERHSIEYDREFTNAVAQELLTNSALLQEVRQYPEKLIELVFTVVDKEQRTLPFFLNDVQHEFIKILNQAKLDFENGIITEISLLILKGRQQGFTTLVTAYQLACCILNRNFQGFTLADESDNTEAIFQNKAKFPYSKLPEALKPTEKYNNRRQLMFERINSTWAVDTATKDVGRSRTVNFFHGSECAFWKDGISRIQAAIGEAFTRNCIKIYESTANGYNDYEAMWKSGRHINCFFPWWKTKEYRIRFGNEEIRTAFLEDVQSKSEWVYERLRWLRDKVGLDEEQLYWYWNKYENYLEKDLIMQEYPCFPEEAFLLSGKPVFDRTAIINRLSDLPKPIKTGYFRYDYDGLKISNIQWISDAGGFIRIFQVPDSPTVTKYCIGGDTAGDGSDFYTGHVLDARTGIQVAHLKHQFDPDQYTRQMYCLGMYYKQALIGIETNFDTYPIMELQRLGYTRQYIRMVQDTYTKKMEKRFGFKTTKLTRPTILSRLIEIIRDHCDTVNDEGTLKELLTIVKNEKGRIEAPEGGHDDDMMGLAIAHEVRQQVVFDDEPMEMPIEDSFWGYSEPTGDEEGSEIIII